MFRLCANIGILVVIMVFLSGCKSKETKYYINNEKIQSRDRLIIFTNDIPEYSPIIALHKDLPEGLILSTSCCVPSTHYWYSVIEYIPELDLKGNTFKNVAYTVISYDYTDLIPAQSRIYFAKGIGIIKLECINKHYEAPASVRGL